MNTILNSYHYNLSDEKHNFFQGNSPTFDFLFCTKHELKLSILLKKEIILFRIHVINVDSQFQPFLIWALDGSE